jgi:hypothetical protein
VWSVWSREKTTQSEARAEHHLIGQQALRWRQQINAL